MRCVALHCIAFKVLSGCIVASSLVSEGDHPLRPCCLVRASRCGRTPVDGLAFRGGGGRRETGTGNRETRNGNGKQGSIHEGGIGKVRACIGSLFEQRVPWLLRRLVDGRCFSTRLPSTSRGCRQGYRAVPCRAVRKRQGNDKATTRQVQGNAHHPPGADSCRLVSQVATPHRNDTSLEPAVNRASAGPWHTHAYLTHLDQIMEVHTPSSLPPPSGPHPPTSPPSFGTSARQRVACTPAKHPTPRRASLDTPTLEICLELCPELVRNLFRNQTGRARGAGKGGGGRACGERGRCRPCRVTVRTSSRSARLDAKLQQSE